MTLQQRYRTHCMKTLLLFLAITAQGAEVMLERVSESGVRPQMVAASDDLPPVKEDGCKT